MAQRRGEGGGEKSMGRLNPTPFLFQINGQILYGRSHQNASTIINNAPFKVKIVLIRQDVQSSRSRQKKGKVASAALMVT